jgi:hypothetical protein
MSEIIEQTVIRDYIVSRQKYEELKALQIQIGVYGKLNQDAINQYYQARRTFYKNKGIPIPYDDPYYQNNDNGHYTSRDVYEGFEFTETRVPYKIGKHEARYLNVIYGIIKGREYKTIEKKVRKGNELNTDNEFLHKGNVKYYGQKYGLSSKEIDIILSKVVGIW